MDREDGILTSSETHRSRLETRRGAVVVTGASSGIGKTCAVKLAQEGFTVFAGVRNPDDGEKVADLNRERIIPLVIDITDESSIAQAVESVRSQIRAGYSLKGLVNNAGITVIGPLELLPMDQLRKQFEVNTFGHMATTQAFLPMLRSGKGRIVNVGSIMGELSFPLGGAYGASKAALRSLTESLRLEVDKWGIQVSLIEPGNVKTTIWDKHVSHLESVNTYVSPEKRALYEEDILQDERMVRKLQRGGSDPEAVAQAVTHSLTALRAKNRYLVGSDARGVTLALKVAPQRFRDIVIDQWIKNS